MPCRSTRKSRRSRALSLPASHARGGRPLTRHPSRCGGDLWGRMIGPGLCYPRCWHCLLPAAGAVSPRGISFRSPCRWSAIDSPGGPERAATKAPAASATRARLAAPRRLSRAATGPPIAARPRHGAPCQADRARGKGAGPLRPRRLCPCQASTSRSTSSMRCPWTICFIPRRRKLRPSRNQRLAILQQRNLPSRCRCRKKAPGRNRRQGPAHRSPSKPRPAGPGRSRSRRCCLVRPRQPRRPSERGRGGPRSATKPRVGENHPPPTSAEPTTRRDWRQHDSPG